MHEGGAERIAPLARGRAFHHPQFVVPDRPIEPTTDLRILLDHTLDPA